MSRRRRATAPQSLPRLKLSGPPDIVAAVPYLFGYEPLRSLVIIGLKGIRARLATSMRVDIPPKDHLADVVESSLRLLGRDLPDRVILVIYPDSDGAPPGALHHAYAVAFAETGVGVDDVIVVHDGRWWSLHCVNPRCCPLEGTPIVDADAFVKAATAAMLGMDVPLESREALYARVRAVEGAAANRMARALDKACDDYCDGAKDLDRDAGVALFDARLEEGRRRIEEGIAVMAAGPDQARLSDQEAAWIIVALADTRLRDAALEDAMLGVVSEEAEAFWLDLTRRAVYDWAAAPATVAAIIGWQAGSGTRARIAIERALECDPDYALARLVEQALDAGLPPQAMRTARIQGCP